MLKRAFAFALIALLVPSVAISKQVPQKSLIKSFGKISLYFEKNQGQTDARVKYLARGKGYTLHLTPAEAVLSLYKPAPNKKSARPGEVIDPGEMAAPDVLRMSLIGANESPEMAGEARMAGRANYFTGNDPEKWRPNIPLYKKVRYRSVYPGIDLIYYGNQKKLEFDFVLKPGADPNRIKLKFDGADKIAINDKGDLVLSTPGGEVVQKAPVIYQTVDGTRKPIAGKFVLFPHPTPLPEGEGGFEVGFQVAAYDKTRPLVIDPVLVYSTYLGGGNYDVGNDIAVDAEGGAYVTGYTRSNNFPTANAAQPSFGGGEIDTFVTKLSADGALVYSTYLGGSNLDIGYGIAIDASGSAYLTGYTHSNDFPTVNALLSSFVGEVAFVTKLSPDGSALVYSTYLGGSDRGYDIAVDASGSAYVTGPTYSNYLPTVNAAQPSNAGGRDIFVTKLNPSGSAVVYSTYLGGSSNDQGNSIAIDASGSAYVTGTTYSGDFPTVNAVQPFQGGGYSDVFVAKLSTDGSAFVYSTYLGGGNWDFGNGIAVDASGSAYVTGWTRSSDFPVANAVQPSFGGGDNDTFITKLSVDGSAFVYSTFLGGSGLDQASSIAVDAAGNAYVTGSTDSTFPIVNAVQPSYGGLTDAFVTKLSADGSALEFSTYLGGGYDGSSDIAIDGQGGIYIAGITNSTNFPTENPFQGGSGGNYDAFIAKIGNLNQSPTADAGAPRTIEAASPDGAPVTLDGSASSDPDGDTLTYAWTGPFGTAPGETAAVTIPIGTHTITLTVDDGYGGTDTATTTVTVEDTTVADLTAQVSQLKADLDEALTDLEAAETDLDAANDTISDQSGTITQLTAQITQLQTALTAAQTALATAQSDLATAQADLDTANATITTQSGTITQLNGQITQLQTDLATAQSDLATANDDKAALQGQLDAANDRIAALESQIAGLEGDVSDLDDQLAAANIEKEAIQTLLDTANTTITERDATITQLNGQITQLQADLATANATITDQSAEITQLNAQNTQLQADLAAANTTIESLLAQLLGGKKATDANVANAVRDAARAAIDQAASAAGDYKKALKRVQKAEKKFAEGTAALTKGDFKKAVDKFRDAVRTATRG